MHDYQHDGTGFLIENDRSMLLAGLGLGKTIMALTALAELQSFGDMERTLIIAPKRVANTVWHEESKNWTHTKHLSVYRAVGTPKQRRSAVLASLAFNHGICTINPENLEWLVDLLKDMNIDWPFDTIVFDEFSMFKSSTSNRFKTMEEICCDYTKTVKGVLHEISSPVERIFGLTATPAASGVENLWSQVKLLDSGKRLGVRISHFRKAYMSNEAPPGVQYQKWEPTVGSAENVYRSIADIAKVMRPEDHLDMPELVQNDIVVDIPAKVRADMETLESEFLLEVENDGIDEEIIAANAGALANKLMQFSNGACYVGDPQDPDYEKQWTPVHKAKLDALEELDDSCDYPLLIAYWFQSDLERITAKFPKWEVLDKEGSQIEAWNKGEIPRLLIHPASAGHGLNFQYGGNTFVLYSMFWSLELYQQLIGRLHRQGQTDIVSVNRIVIRNSIEQRVAMALASRAETQDELFEFLNEYGK